MEPELLSPEPDEPARRVLIVDDEQSIRRLLNQWTVGLGYQTHQAADADEALAIMRAVNIDIALCDIGMPGHDGVWLIDQIRRAHRGTAIVIVTGMSQLDPRVTLGPGVAAYIVKPFDYKRFEAAMVEALALADTVRALGVPIGVRTPLALPPAQ